MIVRLRAHEPVSKLAERLGHAGGPLAVTDLDLTNCVGADVRQMLPLITECKQLRRFMCTACPIRPSDLLTLVRQLPHLEDIQFSIPPLGAKGTIEIRRLSAIVGTEGSVPLKLQRVYVEGGQKTNEFRLLSFLLRCCPNAKYLHVHLVCGDFHEAVRECHILLGEHAKLDAFRLTSELPSYIVREPPATFDIVSYATVCANLTHQKSVNFRSCARVRDLVGISVQQQTMPFQTTLVAVDDSLTPEWFREATVKHDWSNVRQLCLLLLPPHPGKFYPAAGCTYSEGLRLLSRQFVHLVELNVNTLHFGPGLDVATFLQDGSLSFLQSLSAPPCGFRGVLALARLAACCPDFKELDVRFDRKRSIFECAGCDSDPFFANEFPRSASPAFRNGLARLTLSQVHDAACRWFIECCRPVSTLRLAGCPSELDFERIGRALTHSMGPSCLIIEHEFFGFDDVALLTHPFHFADLQYLYLLFYRCVQPSDLPNYVARVRQSLPLLKCLHVHYRQPINTTFVTTVTWLRRQSGGAGEDLIRNGPCFLSCSTATFIGLAKPLNRDFQPML
ncbi:uncharacterized protein LOC142774780 [Rhipicephalus microplus]|uniref:uncharacterized protein LOC142774780 n=1 Tax=Rhipicephalus microplus TaxID=6941 RepID=UPI003F6B5922